ncbi:hypothetical protein SK854_33680 [Lentzea sp. BCCO 10_0061]|uniref:ATP-grasp domain-containing protein n=1 Tax=Lentzea sokolovensis TaxID=3095429 RepID=A0ABU4V600_9PSEU|nr:hypothetical protein [Lentzea sp. BCCO 10_0061]MDX8147104.1 hypothetical protein [Lentzea sp. BCCO 10_0061]
MKELDRLYWLYPERTRFENDPTAWENYRRSAKLARFELEAISVDDVEIVFDGHESWVYVKGERVDPGRTLFHNKLETWPQFQKDVWRFLSTFQALESSGHCTLIRSAQNLLTTDKISTLMELGRIGGVRTIPTLNIPTRDFAVLRTKPDDVGIDYPVIVKPAHWGSGRGVVRAHDEGQLIMALRLASAAELTMVVQPMLGAGGTLTDVRVMCVDQRPALSAVRHLGPNKTVNNSGGGGRTEIVPVPEDLVAPATEIAERIGTPWIGVDFLYDGSDYHLCEVEIDAYIPKSWMESPEMARVLDLRFASYRRRFDLWLEAKS